MVGLTFSIAASANFPALMLAIFWKRLTTWGAVCSIVFGALGTLLLIYLGPTIQFDLLGPKVGAGVTAADVKAYQDMIMGSWWYFPLKNPCIVTMTGAFLIGIVVSLLKPEKTSEAAFEEMERRAARPAREC